MKRVLVSALSLFALTSSLYAQSSDKAQDPFKWECGNTTIQLGGFVRMEVSSDVDGYINNNDFIVALTDSDTQWNESNQLRFDPSLTRLSLGITQKSDALGDIKLYFEGDFRGASNTVRLRQAYISVKGFLAGQTWTFMSDLAASGPTVDVQNVNSRSFFRTQMVGYRRQIGEGLTAAISAEYPVVSIASNDTYENVMQTIPDVPIYVEYKGGKGHIKAAAVFRSMAYGVSETQSKSNIFGWGTQLSGSFKATDWLSLYSQAIYGEGIGRYINDIAYKDPSLILNGDQIGITAMGGASLGVKANISKSVYLATSYSQAIVCERDGITIDSGYNRGDYYSASIFWEPVKKLLFGAEYVQGGYSTFAGDRNSAKRCAVMVKYTL